MLDMLKIGAVIGECEVALSRSDRFRPTYA
jgi:hypothetical protein